MTSFFYAKDVTSYVLMFHVTDPNEQMCSFYLFFARSKEYSGATWRFKLRLSFIASDLAVKPVAL